MFEYELPDDYVPKPGDVIKSIYYGVNNSPIPSDDNQVLSGLYNFPVAEVENEVYRKTGVRIRIRNRKAEVVTPGKEYRYELEYEVVEARTPVITALAIEIIVAIIAFVTALVALDWFLERNLKVTIAGTKVDLRGLFLVVAVVAVLVLLLRR